MKYYFAIILLVLALSACSTEEVTLPKPESNVSISGNSTVKLDGSILFTVETDSIIRVPQSTYWTNAGPWQIFKKQGNNWQEIFFLGNCVNLCDNICDEEKYCSPGGPFPGCSRVRNGGTYLQWDLTELKEETVLCGADVKTCHEPQKVAPGQYKAVFSYRDYCEGGVSWTLEERPIFTEEFYFTIEE